MKRKYLFFFILILVILLSSFYYYERKEAARKPHEVLVSVSRVQQKNVSVTVDAIGTVVPYNTVSVRAMVEGTLQTVGFKEGDMVAEGQLLFNIDPRPYQAQLAQAKAKLVSDSAQLDNAQAILDRNSKLLKKGYVAAQEYDTLIANTKVLAATIEADKAAIENAQLQLDYCKIIAPISGRVGAVSMDVGNLVKTNDTSPLVVINQISPIAIKFSLPEQNLSALQHQMALGPVPVIVRADKDGEVLAQGKLSFIDNTVDTTTGMISLKATFENKQAGPRAGQLWPGQFVTVSLPIIHLKDAIVIPSRALQMGQRGDYVYVVDVHNKAVYQSVEVGSAVGEETVIRRGLKPGDKVVTEGQLNVVDGSSVTSQLR